MRCWASSVVAALAACSHAAPKPVAPDYRAVAVTPAPPHGDLYAQCLADAAANHRYARAADPDTTLLVFTCTGAPARAFFDALAAHSAAAGSEFTAGGTTYRATNRVRHDLFGVDYCSADECHITLNAGEFLDAK
jgi:hypothetical protein